MVGTAGPTGIVVITGPMGVGTTTGAIGIITGPTAGSSDSTNCGGPVNTGAIGACGDNIGLVISPPAIGFSVAPPMITLST